MSPQTFQCRRNETETIALVLPLYLMYFVRLSCTTDKLGRGFIDVRKKRRHLATRLWMLYSLIGTVCNRKIIVVEETHLKISVQLYLIKQFKNSPHTQISFQ